MTKNEKGSISEKDQVGLELLAQFLQTKFRRPDIVERALNVLKMLHKKKWATAKDINAELGITRNKFYDTLLPVLRREGLIRKRGLGYELNSTFSIHHIKLAKVWIEFADIKRSQPEELKEVLMELIT